MAAIGVIFRLLVDPSFHCLALVPLIHVWAELIGKLTAWQVYYIG